MVGLQKGILYSNIGDSLSEAQPLLESLTNEKLSYGSFSLVPKKGILREGALTTFPFKRLLKRNTGKLQER